MDFKENLDLHIRARYPILYIQTYEEERVLQDISYLAEMSEPKKVIRAWDFCNGFAEDAEARMKPMEALEAIAQTGEEEVIYLLKDFHKFMEDLAISRMLRNLYHQVKKERKTMIIIAPQLRIPLDLEQEIAILDYELPQYEQIMDFINRITRSVKAELSETGKEILVKACQGLTLEKIRLVLFKALAEKGQIDEGDIELILEEKRQVLKRTEILEFYPSTENIRDIGGLDQLKKWIKFRGLAFSQKAVEYGLPYPKGVLLVGMQGTGKSLSAKVISKSWRMPLIRLDVGRLMGSLVGESESRTRQMILTAEAMAPCILWIDELDKAFAGINGLQGDSGTSSRVFGNLLTWMQEKKSPVFIVATANNIQSLPPELLRKGRFDEIFFVDLPNYTERKEIFQVHLRKKREFEIRNYNIEALADLTEGYSGAEIEQIIVDAMFQGFSEEREFSTEDIAASIARTVPLSKTAREVVEALRTWAESGRARNASN